MSVSTTLTERSLCGASDPKPFGACQDVIDLMEEFVYVVSVIMLLTYGFS
jgi:hypothetical protein